MNWNFSNTCQFKNSKGYHPSMEAVNEVNDILNQIHLSQMPRSGTMVNPNKEMSDFPHLRKKGFVPNHMSKVNKIKMNSSVSSHSQWWNQPYEYMGEFPTVVELPEFPFSIDTAMPDHSFGFYSSLADQNILQFYNYVVPPSEERLNNWKYCQNNTSEIPVKKPQQLNPEAKEYIPKSMRKPQSHSTQSESVPSASSSQISNHSETQFEDLSYCAEPCHSNKCQVNISADSPEFIPQVNRVLEVCRADTLNNSSSEYKHPSNNKITSEVPAFCPSAENCVPILSSLSSDMSDNSTLVDLNDKLNISHNSKSLTDISADTGNEFLSVSSSSSDSTSLKSDNEICSNSSVSGLPCHVEELNLKPSPDYENVENKYSKDNSEENSITIDEIDSTYGNISRKEEVYNSEKENCRSFDKNVPIEDSFESSSDNKRAVNIKESDVNSEGQETSDAEMNGCKNNEITKIEEEGSILIEEEKYSTDLDFSDDDEKYKDLLNASDVESFTVDIDDSVNTLVDFSKLSDDSSDEESDISSDEGSVSDDDDDYSGKEVGDDSSEEEDIDDANCEIFFQYEDESEYEEDDVDSCPILQDNFESDGSICFSNQSSLTENSVVFGNDQPSESLKVSKENQCLDNRVSCNILDFIVSPESCDDYEDEYEDCDYDCDLFDVEFEYDGWELPIGGLLVTNAATQNASLSCDNETKSSFSDTVWSNLTGEYDVNKCSDGINADVIVANKKWNDAIDRDCSINTPQKVTFSEDVEILPAEDWCRRGPWEQCARDRLRFRRRIREAEVILNPILSPEHRLKVRERLAVGET